MNYTRIYYSLIERARSRVLEGYTESHHIVPRCMGGGDEPHNLVKLTPEEHFLAHQLLVKMYPTNTGLVRAAHMMTVRSPDHGEGRITNKKFGWLKRKLSRVISEAAKARPRTQEERQKRSEKMKGNTIRKGATMSEESKAAISNTLSGRPKTQEHREKIAAGRRGKQHTPEDKERMAQKRREWWAKKRSESQGAAGPTS
jgi:hypothetical protein